MNTYFIGAEEVEAYLRDLLKRLSPLPCLWCPITESGLQLARRLTALTTKEQRRPIEIKAIEVRNEAVIIPQIDEIKGKSVLLLDSAVHSGRMMTHCVAELLKAGPSSVTSYALAVKRCSSFIPTLWGVMTDETDRPYFLLDEIPNSRLNAGAERPQPPVHMRLLDRTYSGRDPVSSGVASIDRVTWSDRLFQMESSPNTFTYVLEKTTETLGFVTIHLERSVSLAIAEVVVDPQHQGAGYGGILIRFAETMARQSNCETIRLHALSDRIPIYEKFGYQKICRSPLQLDKEEYHPMEREVLYHQGRRHVDGSTVALSTDSSY